jgi:hypothetical protein
VTAVLASENPNAGKAEICKPEPIIKVNIKMTVDNAFNLLIGNKLRATNYITSGNDWQYQLNRDIDVVKGQYIYVMAWNVLDITVPPASNYQMFLAEVNYKING